jgi:hypothetical protein
MVEKLDGGMEWKTKSLGKFGPLEEITRRLVFVDWIALFSYVEVC